MTRASEKVLAQLHSQLAATMTKSLQQNEWAQNLLDEYAEELPRAVVKFLEAASASNPALMAAVSKFLKDNEITCQPDDSEELSELAQTLKNKPRRVSGIPHTDETIN